ncbi:MAG: glutamyl-tRNA reductase [Candidatus Omnitrophica bacterium]|nr:glutamyl-tRNA reductase [Candidatus Omnitrophota bacterium]
MPIAVLGLNHKTAPVELRERLAFQKERVPEALARLRRELHIPECVILSTCNRVELYAFLPELNGHHHRLKEFLARFHQVEPQALGDRLYWHLEPSSIRHLFRVACGLESMVVGESEILGQVREAYQKGVSCGSVGEVFHRLFQTALKTGKAVRSKTRIGQGAVSVSSAAVELARRIFQDLPTKTVLTLGAGAMGEATLQSLKDQGLGRVLVVNRSPEAARQLAAVFGGEAVAWEDLEAAVVRADIVICSTASDRYLLTRRQVQPLVSNRPQRPLFLIDISVPRNLDPAIGDLENVHLYDIDDLEEIALANRRMRLNETGACTRILEEELERFLIRFSGSLAS